MVVFSAGTKDRGSIPQLSSDKRKPTKKRSRQTTNPKTKNIFTTTLHHSLATFPSDSSSRHNIHYKTTMPPPPPGATKKKKKGRPPAHQNTFAFRHNPKSKKTEKILSSPNVGVCNRCRDKIEWRKKYRKVWVTRVVVSHPPPPFPPPPPTILAFHSSPLSPGPHPSVQAVDAARQVQPLLHAEHPCGVSHHMRDLRMQR
jgi:hypothetical protein